MAVQEVATYPDQIREKLAGKTILVIGTSGYGARKVWDIFADANIKIVLVTHLVNNYGESKVDTFIWYDYFTNQSDIEKNARNIIELLGDRIRDIDGCFTFTETDTPITAAICNKLGLRGFHFDAAVTARSKQNTYEALRSKPKHDTGSWGVVKVTSKDDCIQQYNTIKRRFGEASFGEKFGTSMVLMELLEGLSYEVDVVIYDGKLIAGFVTDIGLYLPKSFACTATCIPSSRSKELQDQLKTAAHQCCCKVGLLNGVFNTEFKMTESGPKLVEINGRIGCYRRCIVYQTIYGVILYELAAAIACGIKPCIPDVPARCFAVGTFLFSKFHGKQFLKEDVKRKLMSLTEAKDILLEFISEIEEHQGNNDEFPMDFCHLVGISSTSIQHARQKLIHLYRDLGFTETEYDVERFTSVWA
ncbi:carnosine synthase 1-like [Pecten maximus]|uniref:carnosine synthase 1-like n=1 Tax=Pecten maximus TaxID=6579 RepID=UPI001458953F|nr:carnosine synthase 1-like [Pecten maximus]